MKSIISNTKCCYLCGKEENLEKHHMVFGTSSRAKADSDGLWCYLDHNCHQAIHNQDIWEKQALQKIAQRHWEDTYGDRKDFIKRYGKSYL